MDNPEPTSIGELAIMLALLALGVLVALVTGCLMAYGLWRVFGFLLVSN